MSKMELLAPPPANRRISCLHLWKFGRAQRDPHAPHAPGMAARGDGGAYRDRTDDLKLAKLALSQLS